MDPGRYLSGDCQLFFSKSWVLLWKILYWHRLPFFSRPVQLPDAKAYFFADFRFLVRCLKASPSIWFRHKFIWYTHPEDLAPQNELVFALKQATKVISASSLFVDVLAQKGIKREKLT